MIEKMNLPLNAMRIMKKNAILFLMLFTVQANAQLTDTLKVMSYNLLNFPNVSPNRIDTLKGILDYVKPDILMVCELTSAAGGDSGNALGQIRWIDEKREPDASDSLKYAP